MFLGFDEKRLLMVGYHPRSRSDSLYSTSSSASSSSSSSGSSAGYADYSTPFKNPTQGDEESAPYGFYSPPSTDLLPSYLSRKSRSVKEESEILNRNPRRAGRRRKQPSKMKLTNQHNYMAGAWVRIGSFAPEEENSI